MNETRYYLRDNPFENVSMLRFLMWKCPIYPRGLGSVTEPLYFFQEDLEKYPELKVLVGVDGEK